MRGKIRWIVLWVMLFGIGLIYVPWANNAWEVWQLGVLMGMGIWMGWSTEWRWEWLSEWMVVLVVVNVVGLVVSRNIYYAEWGLVHNVAGMVILYGVYRMGVGVEGFARGLVVIGGLIGIGTYVRYWGWTQYSYGTTIGWLGNANYTSNFLILPIIGGAWLVFLRGKVVYALPLLLSVMGMNVTRSRASIIAAGVGVMVLMALGRSRRVVGGCLAGLAIAGCLFLMTGDRAQLLSKQSLGERMKYWGAALSMVVDKPVFGYGLWSYRSEVYEAQARKGVEYFRDYEMPKPRRVHNDMLETLAESGVVGFGVMAYVVGMIGLHAWRVREKFPVLIAGWAATLVGAFFMFPTRLSANFAWICAFFGVIEGAYRYKVDNFVLWCRRE